MFGLTSNTCPGSLHNVRIEQAFTRLFETEHIARHPLGRDMSTALLIAPHRQTKFHGTAAGMRKVPDQGLPRVVSATSLSAHAEIRAMVRPALPNYALRRLVVGGLATMTLIVGMLGLIGMSAGLAGSPASAASAASAVAVAPSVHVAQSGDTLWSIANTYRGDVDRDRFIDVLIRMNGGVEIQAGQAVWLP